MQSIMRAFYTKPLAIYLFARDRRLQDRVVAETQSGGVCINDTIVQILGNDLPFGGVVNLDKYIPPA